jgi:hypothetical protein
MMALLLVMLQTQNDKILTSLCQINLSDHVYAGDEGYVAQ